MTLHIETVSENLLDLLNSMMRIPELSKFRLVGGTALSLYLGHRKSVDIDLFTAEPFNAQEIAEKLSMKYTFDHVSVVTNSVSGVVDGIKVDLIAHRYPWIDDAVEIDGIRFASIRDIAAMKLNAISNRGSKKDFCDIAVLLKKNTLSELIESFSTRYPHVDVWQVIRSLTYYEDAEEDPNPVSLGDLSWNDIKQSINTAAHSFLG